MLTATIVISGKTIVLKGDAAQVVQTIASLANGPQPIRRGPGRPPGSRNRPKAEASSATRKPLSPSRQRQQQIQGQYLGALKALSPGDKTKAQAVAKANGAAAGLAEAIKLRAAKQAAIEDALSRHYGA